MFGRFSVFKAVLVVLFVVTPHISHAYGVETHYKLTENAVREYKRLGGSLEITEGDLAAMAGGAIHEDEMRTYNLSGAAKLFGQDIDIDHARPANHFFDPIHQLPLTKLGKQLGATSPQWAIDTKAQANFGVYSKLGQEDKLFSAEGDYSWERNVYEYVHGDRRRALSGLGHTLHLLEDATSPAHTRNDAHSGSWMDGDDPYEHYTGTLTPHVTVTPTAVPYFNEPDAAISATAYYTNTNYFSKDTIYDFELPDKKSSPVANIGPLTYLINRDKADISMVETTFSFGDQVSANKYFYIPNDINILSSNWLALSRKAVTNSVGLIRLFERDVEEERKTGALAKKNVSTVEALALRDARVLAAGLGITNTLVPTQLASVSKSLTVVTPQPLPEAPDLDLAYYAPSDETLAAMASAFATANAPLVAGNIPQTQPLPVSPAILPEQTAYTPNQVNSEQLVVNGGAAAAPTPTTTFGGLSALAYGAGVGGGGVQDDRQQTASLTDNRQDQAQNQTQNQTQTNNTPPPALPAAGQGGGENSGTTAPTCTTDEVLDVEANMCVALVVCTTPFVRTNTTSITNGSGGKVAGQCSLPPRGTTYTLLPDTFTEDTTLSYIGSPYIAKPEGSQTITIPIGVTVTIEQGSIVKLAAETHLVVEGTLRVVGTDTLPVTITSLYDTATGTGAASAASFGSDGDPTLALNTNNLEPGTSPWAGITIAPTGTAVFTHATLSYGGWNATGPGTEALPHATIKNLGTLALTNTTIQHSQTLSIAHEGTSLASTSLTIDDSPTALALSAPGYDIQSTTIRHQTSTSTPVVTISNVEGKITGTIGESNAFNGIYLLPLTIAQNTVGHLYPNFISYYTDHNLRVAGTLYLHPGSFIQNVDNRFTVTATGTLLVGDGTGDAPTLTSLWDNAQTGTPQGTVFPNTNRSPKAGDWVGVLVEDGGTLTPDIQVKHGK